MSRIAVGLALRCCCHRRPFRGRRSSAAKRQGFVPHRQRRGRVVHGRKPRRRPCAVGHVRPRLCDRLPRRRDSRGPRSTRCRTSGPDPVRRLAALREEQAACGAPATAPLEGVGSVEVTDCKLKGADVAYRVYQARKGAILYSAEGFAGYDSALRLGLRSVVADKALPGELSIATTGVGDAAALARVQAGAIDASRALAEAYRRNNSGSYAESAEFFSSVSQGGDSQWRRLKGCPTKRCRSRTWAATTRPTPCSAVLHSWSARTRSSRGNIRNYRAMHLLNRGDAKAAMAELDKPVPTGPTDSADSVKALVIDAAAAARLSANRRRRAGSEHRAPRLLPRRRSRSSTARRFSCAELQCGCRAISPVQARPWLRPMPSLPAFAAGGSPRSCGCAPRISPTRAGSPKTRGTSPRPSGCTGRAWRCSRPIIPIPRCCSARAAASPDSTRGPGRRPKAEALFREIVKGQANVGVSQPALARVLRPYVEILLKKGNDPHAVADLFDATQAIVRPGVAETQAILARELSGGSDEASRLFRQAVNLDRQIERHAARAGEARSDPRGGRPAADECLEIVVDGCAERPGRDPVEAGRFPAFPRRFQREPAAVGGAEPAPARARACTR